MLRIGEFARLGNVSIKLVRHYDEIGLLPAGATDPNTGYRYYSVTQLARLNQLLVYRSLGFSLKEVRRLLRDDVSSDQLRDLLTQRRTSLRAKIEAEQARLEEVEARISQIDREGRPSPYEVTIRSIAAAVAVSLRRTCGSYDEVGELLRYLRAKLPSRSAVVGEGAIWHKCSGGAEQIDCEALVFLDRGKSAHPDGLDVVGVPACTVASIICDGTVEDARPAYRAAMGRARRLGYSISGPMRERYLCPLGSNGAAIESQFPLVPEKRLGFG
ncbi:MerR family transcriptional regulator [Steroidobacter cummioxidans]|uniref:MerR family transcriptional regulator n=1 Tax=Steroidobacter cummioxidans TaxID=1803913 RepID=UPI000E3124EF|nr:MerR family transcriptional regulator [Steroidobacter cummioxidans]